MTETENGSLDDFVAEGPLKGVSPGLAAMIATGVLRLVGPNENMCASGLHARYLFRPKTSSVSPALLTVSPALSNYCVTCGKQVFLYPCNLVLAKEQTNPRGELFFRPNYGDDVGLM